MIAIEDLTIDDAQTHLDGTMLPERVLQDLLKVGFAKIHLDQTLLDDLFHKFDRVTRETVKRFYAEHDITVRQNFPRDDIKFPLVAILNSSDNEEMASDLLGDFLTGEVDLSGTLGTSIVGQADRSDFQIFCLTGKDSNAALWLYYVVKALLILNKQTLLAHGLHNVVLSGRDVSLREDLFPEFTYARVLTLTCLNYFSVRMTEKVAIELVGSVFTEDPESGTRYSLTEEDP